MSVKEILDECYRHKRDWDNGLDSILAQTFHFMKVEDRREIKELLKQIKVDVLDFYKPSLNGSSYVIIKRDTLEYIINIGLLALTYWPLGDSQLYPNREG